MKYKYARTPHLPFSLGRTSDDKTLKSVSHFDGKDVTITIKMDGENTSLYKDGFHARSLDSRHHPSRDWLAAFHSSFAHDIPEGWRICGESLYAKHSIEYKDLPSYFMGFSVWDETNTALDWDKTKEFLELLTIDVVPELYRGPFDEAEIKRLVKDLDLEHEEGLVVRLSGRIPYADFEKSFGKWVRPEHVQTNSHWMHSSIIPNLLAKNASFLKRDRFTN